MKEYKQFFTTSSEEYIRLHLRNKPTLSETDDASERKCNSKVSLGSRVTQSNFRDEQFGIAPSLTTIAG